MAVRQGRQALDRMNMKIWQFQVDERKQEHQKNMAMWREDVQNGYKGPPPIYPPPMRPDQNKYLTKPERDYADWHMVKLNKRDPVERQLADYYRTMVRSNPPWRQNQWLYTRGPVYPANQFQGQPAGIPPQGFKVDWSWDEYENYYTELQKRGQYLSSYPGYNPAYPYNFNYAAPYQTPNVYGVSNSLYRYPPYY